MKSRSFIWLFLAEFFFYVSGYVVQMMAGRFLGPEEYGRYAVVITITLLVANLIGSGIPIAMSKFLSEYRAKDPKGLPSVRRESAKAQIWVTSVVTGIFFLLSPVFAYLLKDPTLTPLFFIASLIIPCYAADAFYFYLFSGMQMFSVQSVLKFVRAVLRIVVISGLTYFFHIQGIFIGYLLVPLGVLSVAVLVDRRTKVLYETRGESGVFSIKKIYALAVPITVFAVLFEILLSLDLYALKYFFADDALTGQYNAALTIARIPSFLFYALTLILLPTIAESFAKLDTERAKKIVSNAVRFMLVVGAPFVAFVAAYPASVMRIFFGEKFLAASSFLPMLAAATTILSILYVLAFAYNGAGKIGTPIRMVSALILFNIFLDAMVLPRFGVGSVPFLKLVVALLLTPFLFTSLHKTFAIYGVVLNGIKISFATVVVFFIARSFGDSLGALAILTIPLGIAYLAFLWFTGVIRKEDLATVRK